MESKQITLNPDTVADIFKNATTQADYLIPLYRMVFPNWDNIEKVNGWPQCNKNTWLKIARLCEPVDQSINKQRGWDKQLMVGGAWLNNGFSCHESPQGLEDWQIIPCAVTMKTA